MRYHKRRGWEINEREATSEEVFRKGRRAFMGGAALGAAGLAATAGSAHAFWGKNKGKEWGVSDLAKDLYPVSRDESYVGERDLTPYDVASKYNNFYEFGSSKRIVRPADKLQLKPWEIVVDGEVGRPMRLDAEDLIRKMALEERVYRLRCVEAWAMTIPWTGFELGELLRMAEPSAGAGYVRLETFQNEDIARGQRGGWYPWPYVEGLTMAEAMNELSFLVTGAYGRPLGKQFGAPVRLAVPWKYGFKSIKSLVRITVTSVRPKSFWERVAYDEYGFWANVNPDVPHPRWSQGSERLLGVGGGDVRVATRLFNGYGEYVADMYKSLAATEGQRLWR